MKTQLIVGLFILGLVFAACTEEIEPVVNESMIVEENVTEVEEIVEVIIEEEPTQVVDIHLGKNLKTLHSTEGAVITLTDKTYRVILFLQDNNMIKGGLVQAEIENYPENCGTGCNVNLSIDDITVNKGLRCVIPEEPRAMVNYGDCFERNFEQSLIQAWRLIEDSKMCNKTLPTGYVEYGSILPTDSGKLVWAISMEAPAGYEECTTTCFVSPVDITKISYCGINYGEEYELLDNSNRKI